MDERITTEQLTKLVAEVGRLSHRREQELDRQQVKEILQELNLAPELLDDAIVQLQRREALLVQQRRHRWMIGGVAIALMTLLSIGFLAIDNHQQSLTNITASGSRLTFAQNNKLDLTFIERQQEPEVYYRVTLQQAPIGKELSLKCNWIDPTGTIVHQNAYQTRPIDRQVWDTSCRHQFGNASTPGNWQVEMYLGDRLLSRHSFTVRD